MVGSVNCKKLRSRVKWTWTSIQKAHSAKQQCSDNSRRALSECFTQIIDGRFSFGKTSCVLCYRETNWRVSHMKKCKLLNGMCLAATKTICINAFGWIQMNNSSFSFCVIRLLCSLRTLTLSFFSVMLSRSPNRWLKVNRSSVGRHETMVGHQSKQRKSISSDILNRLFGFPPARCVYSSAVCVCACLLLIASCIILNRTS